MINKDNIKKIIIDVEGSSYIRFETDLELENNAIGDFYWQGDKKFFEIEASGLTTGRNDEQEDDDEKLEKYLSEDAIEYLEELFNGDLREFV